MTDVLKLAEEALEKLLPWALQAGANAEDAISSIRAARAEWGWRPIAEMLDTDKSVTCGKWIKLYRKWEWVTQPGWGNKKAAQMSGYTHFCRPQLPTPPAREEVGNG